MRLSILRLTLPAILSLWCGLILPPAQAEDPAGFTRIFNGRNLAGWKGDTRYWSVRDGAIVGQTTPRQPTDTNTFLVWDEGAPANFELKLAFRLSAQNDRNFANSGIQYRSELVDDQRFIVGGYQADLDLAGKYIGMLYEEKGRGILMMPGEKIRITPPAPESDRKAEVEKLDTATPVEAVRAAYEPGKWNDFRIVAEGNRLRHYLNGVLAADVIDDDPSQASSAGVLALQLHQGPPMTVEFKDLQLKSLP